MMLLVDVTTLLTSTLLYVTSVTQMTSLPIAKDAYPTMTTAMEDAFPLESNILPASMTGETVLVAIPGHRKVEHVTTRQDVNGDVQPAHVAVRSAFMPYDRDCRTDFRSMMATQLIGCGNHNEASAEIQKEVPAKLGSGNEAFNNKNEALVKKRSKIPKLQRMFKGDVQPAHFAVRSAFMPYDRDYRTDFRTMMATQLIGCGDHNEASAEIQKDVPAKPGNGNEAFNNKNEALVKKRSKIPKLQRMFEGDVQPAHVAVRSAFMPYDKDCRTDFRAMMATQLLGYGDHSEAFADIQKKVPARLGNENKAFHNKNEAPVEKRSKIPKPHRMFKEGGLYFPKAINPCRAKSSCCEEYERPSIMIEMFLVSSEDGSRYCSDVMNDSYSSPIYRDTRSIASERLSCGRLTPAVLGTESSKYAEGQGIRYAGKPESPTTKRFFPIVSASDSRDKSETVMGIARFYDGQSRESAHYFSDGVLENDTLDIGYDYYFKDEWGCVTGRNDESGFWKF